jgi:hypothetical protein
MDYPAINIASDKSKQGDYYTTVVGPYDIWAIEYGYTPFANQQKKLNSKNPQQKHRPKLTFGNDGDDMRAPGKAMDQE